MKKTALIVGATGLVGSELIKILLETEEYDRIVALTRRPIGVEHPKLSEKQIDFEREETWPWGMVAEDVYCCIGTTIKKAKKKEAMYKVDVEYPLAIARWALDSGARQFLIISSMNASPDSAFWYPRMKGELERKVKRLPYESIAILRPSLLLGNRKEFRLAESVAGAAARGLPFVFWGPLKKFKAIEGADVARSMYRIAQGNDKGVRIYSSEELQRIADRL